jgi:hypothetical protein
MKEFISKYQKAIVGTGAVAVLVLCYFQQKELAKLRSEHVEVSTVPYVIDSIQHVVDSLEDELFIKHITNGRYELTFEHLKEVNPKIGKEMEDWMGQNTE